MPCCSIFTSEYQNYYQTSAGQTQQAFNKQWKEGIRELVSLEPPRFIAQLSSQCFNLIDLFPFPIYQLSILLYLMYPLLSYYFASVTNILFWCLYLPSETGKIIIPLKYKKNITLIIIISSNNQNMNLVQSLSCHAQACEKHQNKYVYSVRIQSNTSILSKIISKCSKNKRNYLRPAVYATGTISQVKLQFNYYLEKKIREDSYNSPSNYREGGEARLISGNGAQKQCFALDVDQIRRNDIQERSTQGKVKHSLWHSTSQRVLFSWLVSFTSTSWLFLPQLRILTAFFLVSPPSSSEIFCSSTTCWMIPSTLR